MTARAGNGKFVSKSNPIAVIAAQMARITREQEARQEAARRAFIRERRSEARRNGYRGVATRAELAELSASR